MSSQDFEDNIFNSVYLIYLLLWVAETVFRTLHFKQRFFKVTFFKDNNFIFLWIFNLEQKIIIEPSKLLLCLQNMAIIKFFTCQKKFHATSFQWFYKQKFVLWTLLKNVTDITFLGARFLSFTFWSALLTVTMYIFPLVTCLKMKLWNYHLLYLCSIIILYNLLLT